MALFTHRIFHHDAHGFFAKRTLADDYRTDVDGWAMWSEPDERLLSEKADETGMPVDQLRDGLEFMDVLFVPKEEFETTGLEALTDDPAVCPLGQWAAFPPIR